MGTSESEDRGSSQTSTSSESVSTDVCNGPNFLLRSVNFWGRVSSIYASYKGTQLRGMIMRLGGCSGEDIQQLWAHQHRYAGDEMYNLCIALRGFYLKVWKTYVLDK